MQQYRFTAVVNVNGTKQRREFVFSAANWTQARQMLKKEMKKVHSA